YMWGTIGIGYNTQKIKDVLGVDEITSWDAVFKPENMEKLNSCGVYFLDAASDVISTALHYLHLDPSSSAADDVAKAEELLLSVRPYIRKFHSSEMINALANGDICVAVGYSGDLFQARDRAAEADQGVDIAYVIPNEGAQMWFDQLAIPGDAKNVEEAHAFINYILKPEVAAKASNYVFYANGNKASQPLLDKEIIDDPAIYPPEDVMAKLFTVQPYDAKGNRIITRTWTKITTGQ
ncbi:MAG: extracellular solute-binding protein, partial [Mesorhizobium sp.]